MQDILGLEEEGFAAVDVGYMTSCRLLTTIFLTLVMYITGGQPARGPELGSIKFRNSKFSLRNFFVIWGRGCYCTEYHKARASTNFSYFVVRYLPDAVTTMILLYIVYIRPFANMIYNQISSTKNTDDGNYLFCSDKSPHKCWNGRFYTYAFGKYVGLF